MTRKFLSLLLLCILACLGAAAQERESSSFGLDPSDKEAIESIRSRMDSIRRTRPTVALVLSGGGAKGAATIGALKRIDEYGIPVDMVLGTSIGGMIGGMYALGYTASNLDTLIRGLDWSKTLSDNVDREFIPIERLRYKERFPVSFTFYQENRDRSLSSYLSADKIRNLDMNAVIDAGNLVYENLMSSLPSGAVYGQNVNALIASRTVGYSDSLDFFTLPIPFACVATDVISGKAKVWHSGSLNTAIRSTMSIPGLFAPVRTAGMVLLDGGMRNNFPVDIARDMGADIVIGIDLSDPSVSFDQVNNLWDIVMKSIDMFSSDSYQRSLENVDVHIHPKLDGYNMLSFYPEAIDTMLTLGHMAAVEAAPKLDSVKAAVGPDTLHYCGKKAVDIGRTRVRIGQIIINGLSTREAGLLQSRLNLRPGQTAGLEEIEAAISRAYGTGYYDYVNYSLLGKEEPYTLSLDCRKGSIHRFGAGVRFDTEDLVAVLLNLGLNTNSMAGLSLDMTGRLGANPYGTAQLQYRTPNLTTASLKAGVRWTDRNNFISGENNYNISFLNSWARASLGWDIFRNTVLELGLDGDYVSIRQILGTYSFPGFDSGSRKTFSPGAYISLLHDSLDSSYFPESGYRAGINVQGRGILNVIDGSTGAFGVFSMDATLPFVRERFAVIPSMTARIVPGDDNVPLVYANTIGGDMNGRYVGHQFAFIGIDNAAFRRSHLGIARMDLRYRMGNNHYFTATGNVSYDCDSFSTIRSGEMIWGLGLSYAYNTIAGPIKFQLHWSSFTRRIHAYFALGFDF